MPGPPTSSFVQLNLNFSGTAVNYPACVTMGFTAPAMGIEAAMIFIAGNAQALHETISVTTLTLDSVELKAGPEGTGPTFSYPVASPGTVSNDSCGPNVALLVRKVPQAISGRFAGRLYYPGVPATWVTESGDLTTTGLDETQNAFGEFLDAMDDELEMNPMIFSSGSSDPRAVTEYRVQSRTATQRRRLRR